MAAIAADRNLLFGLLALQNGLIDQVHLVAAFQAWTLDKARGLADHLVAHGDLDSEQCALLEALVAQHLKKHGDAEKSLAAIPAGRSTRESLARLGEPDLGALIAQLSPGSTLAEAEDPDRTSSYSVGTATSDGQRFRVLRPHAQGGLGAVFVALDTELHREVALKQILEQHADDPADRQRFLLEAEITGGLEHPGIIPVYGLGTYGDGRPYYAMRFIRGDSLKQAIEHFHADPALQTDPGRRSLELRKLLRRFLDVCNAMDYAHSRGVLHRDIKPGNVLAGEYGETLTVDWGLAKATGRSDPSSGERTLKPSSATGSAETLPGSALGTPAYMSPEQAAGNLDQLGPRSDVYSLGATLYCLLTGRPPFAGDAVEVIPAVQKGEFPPPRAIDPAIDRALEAICLKAMALRSEDRYGSCRGLAEDIERWMADEPVSSWREPWSRRARRWARRHRQAVTGAAAAVLVGLIGVAAAAIVYLQQRQAQVSRLALAVGEVNLLRDQAEADTEGDPVKWHAAQQAVKRAEDLLGPLIDAASQRQVRELSDQVASATQAAERDAQLLREAVDIRSAETDDPDGAASDAAYARAFRDAGIDLDELGSEAAGAEIKSRPAGVALALTAALDDWSAQRRRARPKDTDAWKRLVATARAADPEPTRDRLRRLWSEPDLKAQRQPLLQLAKEADTRRWPPASLTLLAGALADAGERNAAADLLRRSQAEHPGDVWLNYKLGRELEQLHPPRTEEAIRFYSVARALRPETAHELAHALDGRGHGDEAVVVFRNLTGIRSGNGLHWGCLCVLLTERGDRAAAEKALQKAVTIQREAIRLRPDEPGAHLGLGHVLCHVAHDYTAAIAEFREAIRLKPDSPTAHADLGNALHSQGKLDGAVAKYREAIRLKPDYAAAYSNLGNALHDQGKLAEAIAAYREAIRLKPDYAPAHYSLGLVLGQQGKLDEAIAAYREAIRLKPDHALAHGYLGVALRRQGKLDEAIAAYREAIRLKPDDAETHYHLGLALHKQGKLDEAIAAYIEAIRVKPDLAEAHCNLGHLLSQQGRFREALAEFRRGHELGSKRPGWPYPSAEWVRRAERLVALERRLPAVIRGDVKPNDAAEGIGFADLAYKSKQFGPSARLYSESFGADPKLAEDMEAGHRYAAACAAALAGAGQGHDKPPLDEKEKTRWRKQALDWMRIDLSHWTKQAESGKPEASALVSQKLHHWKADTDLAGIRDDMAIQALPADEQKDCRALWAEVDELLAKARAGTASSPRR
jgi:serine/threonine protein kinase/tetratricopeptide (TPR) repeat protein